MLKKFTIKLNKRLKHTTTLYDDSRSAASHFVLSYSNLNDCLRWKLNQACVTPWNWASNWVLEMARPTAEDRLLDLGCIDNPYIIKHCEKHHINATFLDIAPIKIDANSPKNITFVQSDINCGLPFKDESFDVILSESSLEHIPADSRLFAFEEAMRCLRPRGRMAVSLGLPLGFADDPETIYTFENHDFFSKRYCCVYFPIDVKRIIECINTCAARDQFYPFNHSAFPGFKGYNEDLIVRDPNIIFDKYENQPDVPNVAKLRSSYVVEIGIFFFK